MNDKGAGETPARVVELLTAEVAKKSQIAVARETGLTLLTVQRYLKGIGEPREKNLKRLADYFGVSVWELRGEKDSVFDAWPASLAFADKFLLTAACYLDQVLENDYRIIDEYFFIGAVLSFARMVIDMPATLCSYANKDELLEIQSKAKDVINKYSESYLQHINQA